MSRAADTPSDGKPGLALLQPVRMNTGRAFVVGAAGWRVVDQVAQRIDADADDPTLRTLAARAAGSECLALVALLQRQRQPQPGFATDMLEDPGDDRHSFRLPGACRRMRRRRPNRSSWRSTASPRRGP